MIYLLVHLFISALMFLVGAKTSPLIERVGNVLIALFFPIGGVLIVLLLSALRNYKTSDIGDDEFDDPIILFTDHIDVNNEVNVLPIEEVLNLDDQLLKRKHLIDSLKLDLFGLLDKLQLALRDDDVETSHYAASAISEIRRNLDLKLQEVQYTYDKQHDDIKIVDQYIAILQEYINSSLFDEISLARIHVSYEEALRNRIRLEKGSAPPHYDNLIQLLIKTRKFEDADLFIDQYRNLYNNEDSYILKMELYYKMKDRESFIEAYNVLLNSPIALSNRGLSIIRFWMDGMKREAVQP